MKSAITFFSLVLVLASCTKSQDTSAAGMIAAAKAVDQQLQEAFRKKDIDSFMATFWKSPDLLFLDAGRAQTGWDAVRAIHERDMQKNKSSTYNLRDMQYVVHGETVVSRGRFLYRNLENGEFKTLQGWATDAKAMRDGKLVIVSMHIEFDPSPSES